jgi:hypothetical protein
MDNLRGDREVDGFHDWLESQRKVSDYWWCLHCEHVYHVDKWIKNEFWCPNPEKCDGGGPGVDAYPWDCKDGKNPEDEYSTFLRRLHPEYPVIPNEAICYPE